MHSPPVLVLTMSYQFFGTSGACSQITIGPAPGILVPFAISLGCWDPVECEAGTLRVNCTVATESTTWGRVKALYRN